MLKTRVIPTLLWKDVGLVKGVSFNSWRRVGPVLPAIKVYNSRCVDELIVMDISATIDNRTPDYVSISSFCSHCFVPLTLGGGIKTIEQIKNLLRCGADKVCVNSYAYENPEFIKESASYFGSQCIVVAIDVRKENGSYQCYSHAGKKKQNIEARKWAKLMEDKGAGEILLTSIEHDGTLKGYDLDVIKEIAGAVNIPVIASGGAGVYEDFYAALQAGACAVAAASLFHFTEQTPELAKDYLHKKGIPVRRRHENSLVSC